MTPQRFPDLWQRELETHGVHQVLLKLNYLRSGDTIRLDGIERDLLRHALALAMDSLSPSEEVGPSWQPIETAPKSGSLVFLFSEKIWVGAYDAEWDNPIWWGYDLSGKARNSNYKQPTHWRPIFDPPVMVNSISAPHQE